MLVEACTSAVTPQLEAAAAAAPRNPAGQRCCERCGSEFKVEVVYTGWPLRCACACVLGLASRSDWLLGCHAVIGLRAAVAVRRCSPHSPSAGRLSPCRTLIKKFEDEAAPCRTPAKFAKPPAEAGCQLAQFRLNSEADSAWAAAWEEYHTQQACLEAMCKHCTNRHAEEVREQQQERRTRQRGGRRGSQ